MLVMNNSQKQSLSTTLMGEFAPVLVNIIGTRNENDTPHFCGASFVSFTLGSPESIVFSTFVQPTIDNINRTGEFTVNMCTSEMIQMVEQICSTHGSAEQDNSSYGFEWGNKIHAPTLDASPFVCECKVAQSHKYGDSIIFIAEIANQQIDKQLNKPADNSVEAYVEWLENVNVNELDPLLWLGNYHKIGKLL
jgi:flavin reductase (DIM6/NTAB) family NADH-FMN oxidoreductase RutF